MDKFRQILAATDFSAPARHAVERAASVAGQTGAQLTLLHVANLGPLEKMQQWMMSTSIDLKARLLERAHDELERLGALGAATPAGAAPLAARQKAAQAHLADSVAALEGVRLDLLRLHAGSADLAPLTTLLEAARQIGEDVGRLAEAQREVDDSTARR